jgi:hypothetical protein
MDMVNEFFGQEQHHPQAAPTVFEFSELQRELERQTGWTQEFEHHKVQALTTAEKQSMDQVYQQHHTPSGTRKHIHKKADS